MRGALAVRAGVRAATRNDVEPLACMWHEGWTDAHGGLLPEKLVRDRTGESFRARLTQGLSAVRVVGEEGAPLGFHWTRAEELYQLYVDRSMRGAGVAATLIADAETLIAMRGAKAAWLACAIGNLRAARFYEKHGWRRTRVDTLGLSTLDGLCPLDVWRYEKTIEKE
ncbi:MAG: GNAT family N-acetyltransferase [Inquilinaceae bacterium]